jgi:hypothetical protein
MVFALGGATPDTLWTFERAVFHSGVEASEDKFFSKGQPVEVFFRLLLLGRFENIPRCRDMCVQW